MNIEDQIKALEELDGTLIPNTPTKSEVDSGSYYQVDSGSYYQWEPKYLTSYDAIIPLIRNQTLLIKRDTQSWLLQIIAENDKISWFDSSPKELCEALLRATGKWID